MKRHEEALAILDSLKGNEPIEYIREKLLEAYRLDDGLLDAMILYARTYNDFYKKEKILNDAVSHHCLIETGDEFAHRQLIRGLNELALLYMSYGRVIQALSIYQKIYELKPSNIGPFKERLYALYTYFDRRHLIDFTLEGADKRVICLADGIAAFEHSEYERAKKCFTELFELDPDLKVLLKGDESVPVNKRSAELLRDHAYLINRSGGLIKFMQEAGE